jgi:hypothetical protein
VRVFFFFFKKKESTITLKSMNISQRNILFFFTYKKIYACFQDDGVRTDSSRKSMTQLHA